MPLREPQVANRVLFPRTGACWVERSPSSEDEVRNAPGKHAPTSLAGTLGRIGAEGSHPSANPLKIERPVLVIRLNLFEVTPAQAGRVGGSSAPLPASLGGLDLRLLGHKDGLVRPQMGLFQDSAPKVRLHSSPSGRGSETNFAVLCGPPENSRSSSTCTTGRMVSGDILPSLPSSKKGGLLAPSHRPHISQRIHREWKVQDGNLGDHSESHTTRLLDDINRPEGRLFPRSSGKRISQIPPLSHWVRSSSIYLPPLRADNVPPGLFKGPPSYGGTNKIQRGTSLPLPGRPAGAVPEQGAVAGPPGSSNLHSVQLRVAPKHRKESTEPNSASNISGSPVRYSGKHYLSSTTENSYSSRQSLPGSTCTANESLSVPESRWHDGFYDSHGQMGLMEIASLPVRPPTAMEVTGQESGHPHNIYNEKQPLLVASAQEPPDLPLHRSHLLGDGHDRCQRYRLGSPLWVEPGPRQVGNMSPQPRVECLGTSCGLVCPTVLLSSPDGGVSAVENGQHHSSIICEEARGTRSPTLLREVEPILSWAQKYLANISAVFVPGVQNTQADFLSRTELDNNEWSLHIETFRWILSLKTDPEVDLFASPCNRKLKKFYTRGLCSQAIGTDALTDQWRFKRAYAFPPLPVMLRFLQRLRAEPVEVVTIAPYWPNRPWFPLLVQLSCRDPVPLPLRPDLLSQGSVLHPCPAVLRLMVWFLRGRGWNP